MSLTAPFDEARASDASRGSQDLTTALECLEAAIRLALAAQRRHGQTSAQYERAERRALRTLETVNGLAIRAPAEM